MALSAATVWEVRSTATATNINGGGFVAGASGVDYSQQDSAQYTGTNLAGANANGATPDVTSATHTFVADDVGNIMMISAGTNWTQGWYQIVSVAGGAARLDRACASVASPTSGTFNVGGALSFASATSGRTDNNFAQQITPGNTIWFKAGTYATPSALSWAAGSSTASSLLKGYTATRGDVCNGTSRPVINNNTNTLTIGNNNRMENIIVLGASAPLLTAGTNVYMKNCKIHNRSTSAGSVALNSSGAGSVFVGCEAVSYRGIAFDTSSTGKAIGCYFHDSNIGFNSTSNAAWMLMHSVIENCVANALLMTVSGTSAAVIYGNTLTGTPSKRGVGITIPSGTTMVTVLNNIISGFTTGITDASTGAVVANDWNDFYNNTTNYTNVTAGPNSLTVDPQFTNVVEISHATGTTAGGVLTQSGADFTNVVAGRDYLYLISGTGITAGIYGITSKTIDTITPDIAPGNNATADKVFKIITGRDYIPGTNVKALGFPALLASGISTSYVDIGGIQLASAAASTDPGIAQVKTGTAYNINGSDLVGTYEGTDRHTDPGEANVRLGTAYKSNSTSNNKTGLAAIPSAANTKTGVATDQTTGTYDGSDRWTSPSAGDLRQGSADLKSNSLTTNLVGSLVVPSLANTKTGVAGDGGTGTYDGSDRHTDPGIANVRLATAYKDNSTTNNRTGTLVVPAAANVRDGTIYDASTEGILDLPAEADVKSGVEYDNATKEGTYVLVADFPSEADVRDGVEYDDGDMEGTLVLPSAANVRAGITFDDDTVGTLNIGTDEVEITVTEYETIDL